MLLRGRDRNAERQVIEDALASLHVLKNNPDCPTGTRKQVNDQKLETPRWRMTLMGIIEVAVILAVSMLAIRFFIKRA